jgi:hypothetical protein
MNRYLGAPARRILIALAASAALIPPAAALAPTAHAAGTVRSALSLTAPSAATYGTKITLSGVLWRYQTSTRIAGAKVTLQRATKGKTNWTAIASMNTSTTGTYQFSVTQGLAYDYRAYYAGSATYTAAVSPVRYPVVMQRLFLDSIKTVSYETGVLRASGRLYPATGGRVYLQRYNPSTKAWANIGSKVASGNYVSVDAKVGGSTGQYRLYVPMTYPYGAGLTAAKTFTHYVWRGVFKKPLLAKGGTGEPQFEVITEDPARAYAFALADPTGAAWADVNTAGCTRIALAVANFASETLSAKIKKADTTLASATVANAVNDDTPGVGSLAATIGSASKLRLELTDVGAVDYLDALLFSRVLCSN